MNNYINQINSNLFLLFITIISILGLSYSLGFLLFRRLFKPLNLTNTAHLILIILGINILAFLILLTGTLGLLNFYTVSLIIFCGFIAAIILIFYSYKSSFFYSCRNNPIFTVLITSLFLFFLGSALILPLGWDELTYHITIPMRWIKEGNLQVFLDNPYSGFPLLPHTIFRLGCTLGGIRFPGLFCVVIWMLVFTGIYLILKPITNKYFAIFGVVIFLLSPIVFDMLRESYVDIFILLNLIAGLLILQLDENSNISISNVALMLGLISGGAVSVKLTGGVVGLVLFLILVSKSFNLSNIEKLKMISIFIISAGLFAFPFFLRPFLYTGNPFFPYFANFFTNNEKIITCSDFHHDLGSSFGMGNSFSVFIKSIFFISYRKDLYDGIVIGYQYIVLFPTVILYFCYLLIKRKLNCKITYSGLLVFLLYFLWFFTAQQTRFLLPLCLLLTLQGTIICFTFTKKYSYLFIFPIILLSIVNLIYPKENINKTTQYILAWKAFYKNYSSLEFLTKAFSGQSAYIEILDYVSVNTPSDSKLMLIFERRCLYSPRDTVIGSPLFQLRYFSEIPKDGKELYEELRKNEIDYILITNVGIGPDYIAKYKDKYILFSRAIIDAVEKGKLLEIHQIPPYTLLKINKKID